jgi:FtsP/CotA-like multicopper oxidase with cupredoxin domain
MDTVADFIESCLPPEVIAAFAPSPPDFGAIPKNFFYGCNATRGSTEVIRMTQKTAEDETWAMFDLIGAFASATVQVSFDELTMYIIAADGNDIEPHAVNSIMITNGERYTVLIHLQKPKKYTFRVSSVAASQILWGTAVLDFTIHNRDQPSDPSIPFINEVGANTTAEVVFFDVDKTKPYPTQPMPQTVDATYKMTMLIGSEAIYWALNQTILPETTEDQTPLLFAPQPNRQDNHTITIPSNHSWVDYIMLVPGSGPTHPIHVHGRHFFVLGRGVGNFTWNTVEEASAALPPGAFNLVDPPLRDTFATLGAADSWLVIRRRSDNPGVWLMHCHIQSHLQGGMSVIIQDGVAGLPEIPREYLHPEC